MGEAGEEESEGRKRVRGGRGRGEEEGDEERKKRVYVCIYHICLAADPGPTHIQCTDRNANTVSIHIHA